MRAAARLFASVARSSEFLTPNTPTGLTGIYTHPCPRPHLIFLYNSTLDRLRQLPETSVYRQSVEALTKQRLKIIEKHVPAGFDDWQKRSTQMIKEHPQLFTERGGAIMTSVGGAQYVRRNNPVPPDDRTEEWDGATKKDEYEEGSGTLRNRLGVAPMKGEEASQDDHSDVSVHIESEPPLNTQQINEIETEIGAGLLEEIINVAEGELELIGNMVEAKVWEELEEKPVEGQWSYFQRDSDVGHTKAA